MKGETTAADASRAIRGLSAIGVLVRRHDRDRYQTALFAPATRREALFALYAFNYEIARVRESVTQPMLGQIRLQWWREVIDAAYADGATRPHEVALPLTRAIREYGLSREPFDRMIDGREHDLSDAPPADMAALEAYADLTSTSLVCLALEVLGDDETAADCLHLARPVGVGYALAGLLRAMPFHARVGRCYIPNDVAARAGLDPVDYGALRTTPTLRVAVAEIAAAANRHLAEGRRYYRDAARTARPALQPAVVAARYLARLRRADNDPFTPRLARPDALLPWRLLLASLRARY